MLLLALGFSVAAKKLFSNSLMLVFSPWAFIVALKSGWASLFG